MEEEQKFEVQQPGGPNKKKSKKGLIIAIVIILILAVAGGVCWYFFFNKDTKLQMSEESKVSNAANKVSSKLEEITEGYTKSEPRKISKNLAEKPFKTNVTVTGSINNFTMTGVDSSSVEIIKQAIAGQEVTGEVQGNVKEGKFFGKLTAAGQEIGDLVFNNNVAAVKLPSEEKYYALFKDSLASSAQYSELAEIFEMSKYLTADSMNLEKYSFSENDKKHFTDTYGNIFKDSINKDNIKKESAEVTVDGKTEKCDKITYTLNTEDIKNLLKKYVETIKNDTEGQDIVLNKFLDMADEMKVFDTLAENGMTGMSKDSIKSMVKNYMPQILESLNEAIDEIAIEKVEVVVYATNTTTYKVEAGIYQGTNSMKLIAELRDKGINVVVNYMDKEVVKFDLEDGNEGLKATIEFSGAKIEATYKKENNEETVTIKADLTALVGENANAEVTVKETVNEDTETKLDDNVNMTLKVNATGVNIDVSLNAKTVTEIVDSITVPEVTTTNAIDVVKEGYLDKMMSGSSTLPTTPSLPTNTTPSTTTPDTTTPSTNTTTNTTTNTITNTTTNSTTDTNVNINTAIPSNTNTNNTTGV